LHNEEMLIAAITAPSFVITDIISGLHFPGASINIKEKQLPPIRILVSMSMPVRIPVSSVYHVYFIHAHVASTVL